MGLDINEIKKIVRAKEPKFIEKAKEAHKVLNVHVNKVGVAEYLNQVEGYENVAQFKLRKKFAASNKAIFTNLLRPVDKVFTTAGS